MLRGMSYRFRLPLSLAATALFTALVVSLIVAWHTYQNVRLDLIDNGTRLSHALARALQAPLLHDDVWSAYSVLRGPQTAAAPLGATLILLNESNRIFASNKPRELPVEVPLADVAPSLAGALGVHGDEPIQESTVDLDSLPDRVLLAVPITSEGTPIGSLLLVYPRRVLWLRYTAIIEQGALSVVLVLAIITPIGWLSGQKMVKPLTRLADCMVRVREEDPREVLCYAPEGTDEIGCLSTRFRELLTGLSEKRALEQRMITSDRLAAVGRLAAGVAHEINNPLGGMLVAIDTLRKHSVSDEHTERTLALLERGLTQIQDTVSALLLEARQDSHALSAHDIDDTRTLVAAEVDKRHLTLDWDNHIDGTLPLPSTLVRQVVINLLLNATQSTPREGRVAAQFRSEHSELSICIQNEGEAMDQATLDHLFEPYYGLREGGNGLGLWITYQIVQQLAGEIAVSSQPNDTQFQVSLPLSSRLEHYRAA